MKNIFFTTFLICSGVFFFVSLYYIKEMPSGGDMDGLIYFGRKIEIFLCNFTLSALLAFIFILLKKEPQLKLSISKVLLFLTLTIGCGIGFAFLCASIVWQ